MATRCTGDGGQQVSGGCWVGRRISQTMCHNVSILPSERPSSLWKVHHVSLGWLTTFTYVHLRFYAILRRHNYVTPTSYLELILTFKNLLSKKRNEIMMLKQRYVTGLEKLAFAASQVSSSLLKETLFMCITLSGVWDAATVTRPSARADTNLRRDKEIDGEDWKGYSWGRSKKRSVFIQYKLVALVFWSYDLSLFSCYKATVSHFYATPGCCCWWGCS